MKARYGGEGSSARNKNGYGHVVQQLVGGHDFDTYYLP